jgi:hypothetical protein
MAHILNLRKASRQVKTTGLNVAGRSALRSAHNAPISTAASAEFRQPCAGPGRPPNAMHEQSGSGLAVNPRSGVLP